MKKRRERIMLVSRRLLLYSGVALLLTAASFWSALDFDDDSNCRILLTNIIFGCGIIGGFVSIQQRLNGVDDEELELLANSWASVLVIPLFGGIFALVLYVLFLTGIINLDVFPKFNFPTFTGDRTKDLMAFVQDTYPKTGPDVAKLMFWSFVAGFSERFVPQVVQSVASQAGGSNNHQKNKRNTDRRLWSSLARTGKRAIKTAKKSVSKP